MEVGLVWLQVGPLLFLGVMLLIALGNLRRLHRLGDYPVSNAAPMITGAYLPATRRGQSVHV
jgi:hypothetical protein